LNKDFWESRAKKYKTTGYIDYSIAFFDQLMRLKVIERIVKQYASFNMREASILDFGCGNGDFAVYFSSKVRNIVGYDISDEVLKIAREKCKGLSNVYFVNDLNKIRMKFDIVLSITVLQHILDDTELKDSLCKIYSLCNKGALFIALESVKSVGHLSPSVSDYLIFREVKYYEDLLRRIGFRVIAIKNFYNPYFLKTPSYTIYLRKVRIYKLFYKIFAKLGMNLTVFNRRFSSCAVEVLSNPESIDGIIESDSPTKIFVAEKI